jgi:hypothetical protein
MSVERANFDSRNRANRSPWVGGGQVEFAERQQIQFHIDEGRSVRLLALTIFTLVCANVGVALLQRSGDGFGSVGIFDAFDLNAEQSVPAWLTSLLLAGAAYSAFRVAMLISSSQKRWMLLAAILLLASVDETIAGHERLTSPVREATNSSGLFHTAWVIPAIAVGVVLLPAYLKLVWELPAAFRQRFLIGATLYLGGAIVLEMIGGGLVADSYGFGPATEFFVILEESAEMAGAGLTAITMLRLLSHEQLKTAGGHSLPMEVPRF